MISVDTIAINVAPNKRLSADNGPGRLGRDDFDGGVEYNDATPSGCEDFSRNADTPARLDQDRNP